MHTVCVSVCYTLCISILFYCRQKRESDPFSMFAQLPHEEKPGAGISLLLWKYTKGTPHLIYLFDGRNSINSTHALTRNLLRRDLGLNPSMFVA